MKRKARQRETSQSGSLALLGFAGVLLLATALAPRQGSALAVLSLLPSGSASYVQWATERGGRIVGTTPLGGLVIDHAPDGAFYAALRHGTIAIAVPLGLCSPTPGS